VDFFKRAFFFGVFLIPLLRNAQKHHKRKQAKLFSTFSQNVAIYPIQCLVVSGYLPEIRRFHSRSAEDFFLKATYI
jgi:hypothetical protein